MLSWLCRDMHGWGARAGLSASREVISKHGSIGAEHARISRHPTGDTDVANLYCPR